MRFKEFLLENFNKPKKNNQIYGDALTAYYVDDIIDYVKKSHRLQRIPLTLIVNSDGNIPGDSDEPDNTPEFNARVKGLSLRDFDSDLYHPVMIIKDGKEYHVADGRHRLVSLIKQLKIAGRNIKNETVKGYLINQKDIDKHVKTIAQLNDEEYEKSLVQERQYDMFNHFYHGTRDKKSFDKILHDGFIRSNKNRHEHRLSPYAGAYYTTDLRYAIVYAIGGDYNDTASLTGMGYLFTVQPHMPTAIVDEDVIGRKLHNLLVDEEDIDTLTYEEIEDIRDFYEDKKDQIFDIEHSPSDDGGYELSPYEEWEAAYEDMFAVVGKYFLQHYDNTILRELCVDSKNFANEEVDIIDAFAFPRKEAMHIKTYADLAKYKVEKLNVQESESNITISKFGFDDVIDSFHVAYESFGDTIGGMSFSAFEEIIHSKMQSSDFRRYSYVMKDGDKIIGGFYIAPTPIPSQLYVQELEGLRGCEGVCIFLLPEYRGRGLGKKLRDCPKLLKEQFDYMWGMQLESLNNLQNWIDFGATHVVTLRGVHVTYALL